MWLVIEENRINNPKTKQNKNNKNKNKNKNVINKQKKSRDALVLTKRNPMLQNYRQTGTAYGADSVEGKALMSAFANPFGAKVEGVRICDSYAFPTATYHLRGTVAVENTNLVGTPNSGNIYSTLMFSADPLISCVDISGATTGSFSATGAYSSIVSNSMTPFTANGKIFGATSITALTAVLKNYRVVCAGFRVRVTMPEMVRTGRIIVAPILFTQGLPGPNILGNLELQTNSGTATRLLGGIPYAAANSSAILNLPGAFEISMSDLSMQDLVLLPKPTSPHYQVFRSAVSGYGYTATGVFGDQAAYNAAGAMQYTDIGAITDAAGLSGFIIRIEGVPSATINPLVDVEYVYHLEGTPSISGAAAQPLPSGALKTSIHTAGFEKALDFAASLPWGTMVDAGLNGLGLVGVGGKILKKMMNF